MVDPTAASLFSCFTLLLLSSLSTQSTVSVALYVAVDCLIWASYLSIYCWISGDLDRRSSLLSLMQVSRCSKEVIPLKRYSNRFRTWWSFSMLSSDLSARPSNLVNCSRRCPSNVRCHFGCKVEMFMRSQSSLASNKAICSFRTCASVGNRPASTPLAVDQIASSVDLVVLRSLHTFV